MRRFGAWQSLLLAILVVAVLRAPAQADRLKFSGSIYAGYAALSESNAPTGSAGFRDNLLAMFGPHLGVGLELGYLQLGSEFSPGTMVGADPTRPNDAVPVSIQHGVHALQSTVQVLYVGPGTRLRPLATAGAGYYGASRDLTWQYVDDRGALVSTGHVDHGHTKFGINGGLGLEYRPAASRVSVGIEARYHAIRRVEFFDLKTMHLVTVMGGLHFY
jgi:opacity protein-like surface antigen